jgi:hypothetical protein
MDVEDFTTPPIIDLNGPKLKYSKWTKNGNGLF